MNRSILILGIVCAGSAVASGHLWQQLRTQRERADTLQAQVAELQSVQHAPPPPANYTPPPADTPAAAAAGTSNSAGQARTPQAAMAVSGRVFGWSPAPPDNAPRMHLFNGFEQQQRMLKDPEYRKLMQSQHRMSMSRMYSDLTSSLGISREQADQLLDVLAEQQLRAMENRPPMRDPSGSPDPVTMQEWQRYAQEQQQNNEMELATVLGDAKLAEWKEYQESMGARFQVNQLRDVLANGDSPLRQDQMKPLVKAIAQEQRRVAAESGAFNSIRATGNVVQFSQAPTTDNQVSRMEEWIERTRASNQRIHDMASGILSSDQLQGLDEMLNQGVEMQRMQVRMMRANAEAAERGEVPVEGAVGLATSSQMIAVGP